MPTEHRYQKDVLSALLKWTLIAGLFGGLLNLLWSLGDITWTTWAGSGCAAVLSAIAWWCIMRDRAGQTRLAARVFVISGMTIMALVIYTAAKSEVVLAAMGLCVFVVIATFFEAKRTAMLWGVASVVFYEAAMIVRWFAPLRDHGDRVDELSLYLVPPIVLMFFALIGRIMTHHIIDALLESEQARTTLARAYTEVEQHVEERTRDLVQERNRLNATLSELAVARDQAEAASRAKSTFLATMSHELRTPLTAILGYAGLIEHASRQRGHLEIIDDLGQISAAGQSLLALISDVLDLSALEAGKIQFQPEPCDVAALVDEVADAARPLAEQNGNILRVERRGELGVRLLDRDKTRQVLMNLLSNAAKFTERGAITLRVGRMKDEGRRMKTGSDESFILHPSSFILFEVVDTGIGIAPDELRQIFQPFTKGDNALERSYGGAGLGLTLCQRYCDLMGGEIVISSVIGQGTTCTVRVPAALESYAVAPNGEAK